MSRVWEVVSGFLWHCPSIDRPDRQDRDSYVRAIHCVWSRIREKLNPTSLAIHQSLHTIVKVDTLGRSLMGMPCRWRCWLLLPYMLTISVSWFTEPWPVKRVNAHMHECCTCVWYNKVPIKHVHLFLWLAKTQKEHILKQCKEWELTDVIPWVSPQIIGCDGKRQSSQDGGCHRVGEKSVCAN